MKIANITLHAIDNYGSVLQALATEKIFQDLGFDVETIDYIRETAQLNSFWKIIKYGGPGWKIKCKQLILHCMPKKENHRAEKLDSFRRKYLHLTPVKYRSDADLYNNPPQADIYCTGSDQTWNVECQGGIPYAYFLDFVPKGKKKIAFSASFGIEALDNKYKADVKNLLLNYNAISVRESSGVSIVKKLGLEVTQVLDPTIAVGKALWVELAANRIVADDYLFVYQLNSSSIFEDYVCRLAKVKKMPIVYYKSRPCGSYKNALWYGDASPEELLSLIKYAKFAVTDSFHATVFCLMLHTNFVNVFPSLYSSRLASILSLTNLECRRITDFNDFSQYDVPIDFIHVDKILSKERVKTYDFLKQHI